MNSQRPLHALHPVTLDNVADFHILIIFERHAAFLAGGDFTRVILEALELRQLALMHDDVVADQPHIGAALDRAVGDPAAGDIIECYRVESVQRTL